MDDPSWLCPASFSMIPAGAKLLPVYNLRCEYSARYCQEYYLHMAKLRQKGLINSCEVWKADYMFMMKSGII